MLFTSATVFKDGELLSSQKVTATTAETKPCVRPLTALVRQQTDARPPQSSEIAQDPLYLVMHDTVDIVVQNNRCL